MLIFVQLPIDDHRCQCQRRDRYRCLSIHKPDYLRQISKAEISQTMDYSRDLINSTWNSRSTDSRSILNHTPRREMLPHGRRVFTCEQRLPHRTASLISVPVMHLALPCWSVKSTSSTRSAATIFLVEQKTRSIRFLLRELLEVRIFSSCVSSAHSVYCQLSLENYANSTPAGIHTKHRRS